eukprot:11381656-Karenia_brevis.AAC.1
MINRQGPLDVRDDVDAMLRFLSSKPDLVDIKLYRKKAGGSLDSVCDIFINVKRLPNYHARAKAKTCIQAYAKDHGVILLNRYTVVVPHKRFAAH